MTRINAFIPPAELSDKHLIAEHREIKRIPNMVKSGKAIIKDIPHEFTLGKGHVKFFYNKLYFLHQRYDSIFKECLNRGFNVTPYHEAWSNHNTDNDIPYMLWLSLFNDWQPGKIEIKRIQSLIRQRIIDNNIKSKIKKDGKKRSI